MQIKPVRDENDHAAALSEIEHLWGAKEGSAESDRLEVLTTLVEAYNAKTSLSIRRIRFRQSDFVLNREARTLNR
jgi:antitoxin component HigA of HigAB toxin-antitoxin module